MTAARPVVLATGGTGGHVFPAEALAGELEGRGVPFALVTDSRGRQWHGALAHHPIHYIRSASPTGSWPNRIKAAMTLALGLFDAWRALGRIAPSAVVGFGGYASVPPLPGGPPRPPPAPPPRPAPGACRAHRPGLAVRLPFRPGVSRTPATLPVSGAT
ncbi:MAG: glycosyltransferase, partial [Reyranella sp.]|nr:glycosyltransferase [Reyranella sp.]